MKSTNDASANHFGRGRRPQAMLVGAGLMIAAALVATSTSSALAAGVPGSSGFLGNAEPFSVLGGSSVTNTGAPTHVWGDVGVSPGTAIVGLQTSQVGGSQHAADSTASSAQTDLTTAYNNAAGATPSNSVDHSTIGNQTFAPGVYAAASTMGLTGTVTLDGGGNAGAVWVFQAGSTLTTASSSSVVVINGNPCNVFWQVGSSATLGSGSSFIGTVLANTAITAVTGATVQGRLLARNAAVTLDSNQITQPVCSLTDATGATIVSSPSPSPTPTASSSPTATPTPTPTATPTPTPTASSSSPTTTPTSTPTSSTPAPSTSAAPSASTGTGSSTGAGTSTSTGAGAGAGTSTGTGAGTGTVSKTPIISGAPTGTTAPAPAATRSPRNTSTPTATPTSTPKATASQKSATTRAKSGTSGQTGSTTGSTETVDTSGRLATTGTDVRAPLALAGGLFGLGALLFAVPTLRRPRRRH